MLFYFCSQKNVYIIYIRGNILAWTTKIFCLLSPRKGFCLNFNLGTTGRQGGMNKKSFQLDELYFVLGNEKITSPLRSPFVHISNLTSHYLGIKLFGLHFEYNKNEIPLFCFTKLQSLVV